MDYKTAYNKIIDAYFKDELKPYNRSFCFCGTLAGNDRWNEGNYSFTQYHKMEDKLLSVILFTMNPFFPQMSIYAEYSGDTSQTEKMRQEIQSHPLYEDGLFAGMCAALDVLKQIHKERGENVDEEIKFTKRELVNN